MQLFKWSVRNFEHDQSNFVFETYLQVYFVYKEIRTVYVVFKFKNNVSIDAYIYLIV